MRRRRPGADASSRAPRSRSTPSATRASSRTRAATRVAFFAARRGVADVLDDAVALAARRRPRPRRRRPARGHRADRVQRCPARRPAGDHALETLPRGCRYGVISNRHGRARCPASTRSRATSFSVFADRSTRAGTRGHAALRAASRRSASRSRRSSASWASRSPATSGRTRCRPARTAATSTSTCSTVGSTLYLPVQVDGALAYVGDPHFAQGDGEVALTAMEASLRATLRLDVVPHEDAVAAFGELAGPLAETTEHLVPTGLDEDLDVAVQNCVRAAIALLAGALRHGPARYAYAYLSRRDRLRHLAGRRRGQGRARARSARPTSRDRRMTQAPVPAGLIDAFWDYERALMADDLPTLDRLFAPGPATLRGDAAGLLVGHDPISAFRSGAAARRRAGSCRPTCRPSTTTTPSSSRSPSSPRGGRGQQTQLWVRSADGLGGHRRPRRPCRHPRSTPGSGGWSATRWCAATDAGPLDGETVAVKDLYAVAGPARSAPATRPGWPAARVEPAHARAVEPLLAAGADGARDRPHRRVRLLPRRHQRRTTAPRPTRGAAADPGRLVVGVAAAVVARPGDHRPRHRHRRLDPGAGVLPGSLRHPHHARRRLATTACCPLAPVLRHRRLADPRRRPAARRRRGAAAARPRAARRATWSASPACSRRRARTSRPSSTGTPPSTARSGSPGTSATCRAGSRPSRPCRPGRRGRSTAPGWRRGSTTLGADVRGRFEAASLIDDDRAAAARAAGRRGRRPDPRPRRRPGAGAAVGRRRSRPLIGEGLDAVRDATMPLTCLAGLAGLPGASSVPPARTPRPACPCAGRAWSPRPAATVTCWRPRRSDLGLTLTSLKQLFRSGLTSDP